MGLETGVSPCAQPDARQAIVHAALLGRRAALRRDWQQLLTVECLEQLGSSATKVAALLSGPDEFHELPLSPLTDCAAGLSACLTSIGFGELVNISADFAPLLAEEVLRKLMVVDRARIEAGAAFDVDEVVLRLNLAAACAWINRDLRFLDALNYYYELPRRSLVRLRRNPGLLAAWLCLYAQLLCAPDW